MDYVKSDTPLKMLPLETYVSYVTKGMILAANTSLITKKTFKWLDIAAPNHLTASLITCHIALLQSQGFRV